MRVLEIGPSPSRSKGGMAAVIKGIQEDKSINAEFDIDIHESYIDGHIIIRLLFSIYAYIKFLCIYKKFDVFHIHVASYGSTFRKGYYVRLLKKKKKKVILHIHGGEYLVFLEGLSERKKKIVYDIWNKSDIIIVLSDEWKKKFDKLFLNENIVVIENGINIEEFDQAICDIEKYRKNFLMLGRLGKSKGAYDIIEAVKQVKSCLADLKIYMAGDGEIEQVRKEVKNAQLEDQIEVLGWVDFEKKIDVMKRISTILLPSYNEGLPMTILEGMAAGKVIISTKVGGIPEIVTSFENGILIEPGDINALASAMVKVAEDCWFDKKCSENNIRKMKQKYNRKIMHKKIAEVFRSVNSVEFQNDLGSKINIVTKLIYKRSKSKNRLLKKIYTKMILLCGADIPQNVKVGVNVNFCHNCLGTVIYDGTVIEDNVRIYQNVTVGLSNPMTNEVVKFRIKEGAILCTGAKVLGKQHIIVGKNTVIGANSVLLCSTGDNEVWAGIPARCIKKRIEKIKDRNDFV